MSLSNAERQARHREKGKAARQFVAFVKASMPETRGVIEAAVGSMHSAQARNDERTAAAYRTALDALWDLYDMEVRL